VEDNKKNRTIEAGTVEQPSLESRLAALEAENRQLKLQASTQSRLERLEAEQREALRPAWDKAQERAAALAEQRRQDSEALDAALLEGPSQWVVKHDGDPTTIVGARDKHEAWLKYRGYFHIRQADKEPVVEEHVGPRRSEHPVLPRESRAEKPSGPVPMAIRP
jgi:hypothetical protein